MQIAIDGPAGAGKSTIAKIVAAKLNFIYVDTGAMYRAMALYMNKLNLDANDEKEISKNCHIPKIDLKYENETLSIYLNDENVSDLIRTSIISDMASVISTYEAVREHLVYLQRKIAESKNVVMDGRDIGTHVLKDATLKIYMTASVDIRAIRRVKELEEKGTKIDISSVKKDIEKRDERDKNRKINPLKKAEDAIEIDTSNMSIDDVVNYILKEFKVKIK